MATANLALTTISGNDYVSYETLNTNFNKLDVLGKDYVTEVGTSGIWTYRKWKSGYAEFWGKRTFAATQTQGNLAANATFPFKMNQASTYAVVSGGVDGRNDAHVSYVNIANGNEVNAYIYKPTTTNSSYWAFYQVQGKMA